MRQAHPATVTHEDPALLAALRDGDETAFVSLVERYHASLLRLARMYVDASAVDDVVQDTWIGVLHGLPNFEGRASFKTWLFHILVNRARTKAVRDARTIPMSTFVQEETEAQDYAVDPSRFRPADDRYPGHWMPLAKPSADVMPEERLLAGELDAVVRSALEKLPPAQAEVVRLRDVEGVPSDEVCQLLNLTEGNQRVLLHRGRSKIRSTLEVYLSARAN
ncbi:MAG: sigma-70 family RNA polymerase sigma factor [Chloroflexi bacterium]|nr:sigma-70 family RNA polymerase sigma factor [Chloroflexota bacterium]